MKSMVNLDGLKNKQMAKKKQLKVADPKKANANYLEYIDELFPDQKEISEYIKEVCKGYALKMSVKSIENTIEQINKGNQKLTMGAVIPQELAPTMNLHDEQVKQTQSDRKKDKK